MNPALPIDSSAKAVTLAGQIEQLFGFVTIGFRDGAGLPIGETVTQLWTIDLSPLVVFKVKAGGTREDWRRQQAWLKSRYGSKPFLEWKSSGRPLVFVRVGRVQP